MGNTARQVARRLDRLVESYWELRYEYGQLRARVVRLEGQPEADAGGHPPEPASTPGMFAFAAPGRIEELLQGAGFTEVTVDAIDIRFEHPSFDHWWGAALMWAAVTAGLLCWFLALFELARSSNARDVLMAATTRPADLT